MKYIIFLLISTICFSCGTAHKLKKAQRLINEAKDQGANVNVDTVYQEKPIFIKGETVTNTITVKKDTTIFKTIDRVKIKEVIKHDTINQVIQCPDSVVKSKEAIAVNQTINCPPVSNHFWQGVGVGFIIALLLAGIVAYLKH